MHAVICTEFRARLKALQRSRGARLPTDIKFYFQMLESIFYEKITPSSVQRDIMSLQQTYAQVIKVDGDYPSAHHR